ncbi:MAG: hypothetical protein S4CHLAM123_15050 [Chlamydiales bacterium]|nr:hypothetical protein [Chlamydiales bacterium]
MKLYLVRHGECISSAVDPEQPLSEIGLKETKALAELLKPYHLEIDEIMHSVKLRAQQTAQILGETLAPDLTLIQREGLKPMDAIEPLLEDIRYFDRNVMLVGHLPFMERLLTQLLFHEEKLSPIDFCGSCIVCLEGKGQNYQIKWVVSPQLFHSSYSL